MSNEQRNKVNDVIRCVVSKESDSAGQEFGTPTINQSPFLAPDPRIRKPVLPTDPYLRRTLFGSQACKERIPDFAACERGRIRRGRRLSDKRACNRERNAIVYTSDLTGTKLRLSRGSYPSCAIPELQRTPDGYAGWQDSDRHVLAIVTVMLKQSKKFQPSNQKHVEHNLLRLTASCYIEIPGDPQDPMSEPRFMRGLDVLKEALRAYAYKSKLVAKYLEHESLLNNPLHKELFPTLRDEHGEWREPTQDEICQYAGIEPSEFLGQCYAALHHFGMEQAKLAVVVAAPEIVRAAVASAKIAGKEGAADRKMLLEAAKVVEPAGALVSIDQRSVTVNNNYPGQGQGLPAWPGLAKNDGIKQLAAATTEQVIEGELVEQEVEYANR